VLDLPGVRELEDCLLLYGNHPGRLEDEVDRVSRQLFGIAYQDTQFDMPDAYWDLPEFSPERIKLDVAFDDYEEQFETGEELADDEAMEALKRLGLDFSDARGQPLRCTKRMSRPAEMAAKGVKGKLPDRESAKLAQWEDTLAKDRDAFLTKKRKKGPAQ
jgi:hypothetical protein